ncbi:MAG: hypothetical protein ACI9XO_002307 [Paraglaciecola sp.]
MLKKNPPGLKGKIVTHRIILDIVDEEVHYWSPLVSYGIGKYGEQLAKDQTETLKHFLKEVIFF